MSIYNYLFILHAILHTICQAAWKQMKGIHPSFKVPWSSGISTIVLNCDAKNKLLGSWR